MTALKPCPACGAEFPRHWQVGGGSKACPNNSCNVIGPMKDDDGAKWNAMARPSDIVAARIDGLREGAKIVQAEFFMKPRDNGYESWETPCFDDVEPALNARIAELEATAPEVSEVRAKAEAFDAALAYLKDANAYYAWWMENALAEAKRKGAGT